MPHPLLAELPLPHAVSLEWQEPLHHDGVLMRPCRLETMRWHDQPVTTWCLYGEPEGDHRVPGILHLHGGGQTTSPEQVALWVKRGYACVSFDWTGMREGRELDKVAHYPEDFPTDGSWLETIEAHDTLYCHYLHGLIGARALLGVLADQPRVDATRLGAYGISWGGFLTWLLNGVDSRLSAACAIYGTGGLHWPGHIWQDSWAQVGARARQQWMSQIEPRTHVPFQHAPIAFLNASNDFFGGLDVASELLPMIPQPWRADFSPNSDHHISGGGAILLERWFDHYLRGGPELPETPELRLKRDQQHLTCTTTATGDLELWVSEGSNAHRRRHWRVLSDWREKVELEQTGDIWLFLRQRFADGLCLSSAPICLQGCGLPSADATIWQAPSRDGIGIYMRTQPEMAGDVEQLYDLRADGLTTWQPDQELSLLVQVPPGGHAAQAIELDVAGCAGLDINLHLIPHQISLSPEQDGLQRVDLPADQIVDTFLLTLKSRPGERPVLHSIRWATT